MSDWSAQVDKVFREMEEEVADKVVRKVGLTALSTLVKTTPVDTGRAKNGWEATKPAEFGDPFLIVNNVEYIGFLDDGWSQQAPAGMTSVMISQLEAQFGAKG